MDQPQHLEDTNSKMNEPQNIQQSKENENEKDMESPHGMLSRSESHRSVGTMLSYIDPFSAAKSAIETPISKLSGSNSNNAKHSTFWGRKNVSLVWLSRKTLQYFIQN